MTPEEIEQRIREDHPEFIENHNGVDVVISPDTDPVRYEALIDERVAWRIAQQESDDHTAAEKEEFARAREVYRKLNNPAQHGQATNAERDRFIAFLARQVFALRGENADNEG